MAFSLQDVQDDVEKQLLQSQWFDYPEMSSRSKDITHAAVGLSGEAGEVLELVKKTIFRNKEHSREEFISELGDVLWYLAAVATLVGVTLDGVWDYNSSKLADRRKNGKNGVPWEG